MCVAHRTRRPLFYFCVACPLLPPPGALSQPRALAAPRSVRRRVRRASEACRIPCTSCKERGWRFQQRPSTVCRLSPVPTPRESPREAPCVPPTQEHIMIDEHCRLCVETVACRTITAGCCTVCRSPPPAQARHKGHPPTLAQLLATCHQTAGPSLPVSNLMPWRRWGAERMTGRSDLLLVAPNAAGQGGMLYGRPVARWPHARARTVHRTTATTCQLPLQYCTHLRFT